MITLWKQASQACSCRKPLLLCKYSITHPVLYKTSYEYVSSVFWIDTYGWDYPATVQMLCIYQCPEVYGKFSFSCFCIFPIIWCCHLFMVAQVCIVVIISGSLIFFLDSSWYFWNSLGICSWSYINFFASCFHEVGACTFLSSLFVCLCLCVHTDVRLYACVEAGVNIACLQSLFSLGLEIFSWTWSSLALLEYVQHTLPIMSPESCLCLPTNRIIGWFPQLAFSWVLGIKLGSLCGKYYTDGTISLVSNSIFLM